MNASLFLINKGMGITKFLASILYIVSISLITPAMALSAEKSVIVGFHQKPGPSERALIRGNRGLTKRTFRLINAISATLPEEEIEQLKKNKKVAYVEENAIYWASEDPPPGQEYTNSWGVEHIGAADAHSTLNKGTGVKIAVIDTGIDYTHEDLDDNYAGGYVFVEYNPPKDPFDPFDDNTRSHGTHVAGIIAAEENGTGVIGVAPEAEIYALKALDGGGFGLESWIIAAIEWAVDNQMDIVNLSLEGPHTEGLQIACNNAYNAGVLLVAAGGNTYGGSVSYPAAYDSVIAVAATDPDDLPADFSPVGPELELAAPGFDILSTVTQANGTYSLLSGTSQAAPHVAGTAALILLSNTEDLNGDQLLNHEDVRLKLQTTALDLGDPGFDTIYGFGLLQAPRDSDGDAVLDSDDNCPTVHNPGQEDTYPPQGNAIGDACDCEGDFACDGNVDGSDVGTFLLDFARGPLNDPCTASNPCSGDFDCSRSVDATDLNIFLEDFGRSLYNDTCPACQVGDWCAY
jgi:subtilisin